MRVDIQGVLATIGKARFQFASYITCLAYVSTLFGCARSKVGCSQRFSKLHRGLRKHTDARTGKIKAAEAPFLYSASAELHQLVRSANPFLILTGPGTCSPPGCVGSTVNTDSYGC